MESPIAVAVIPARGGSQGVPRKNLRVIDTFNGETLLGRCIRTVQASSVNKCYVSTEDEEIAAHAIQCGADVIERPAALATSEAMTVDVLLHAAKFLTADILCLVQCTTPLMVPEDIDSTITRLVETGADVAIACTPSDALSFREVDGYLAPVGWDVHQVVMRRQDRDPLWDTEGSVWASWLTAFRRRRTLHTERMVAYHAERRRLDIDSAEDLDWARAIIARKHLTTLGPVIYDPS